LPQFNKPFRPEKFRKNKPNRDEPVDLFLTYPKEQTPYSEGQSHPTCLLVAVSGNNEQTS
jgi:hypothetical protein